MPITLAAHTDGLRSEACDGSFGTKPQLNDKMTTYFVLPEPIRYEDGVEHVEIELAPE